MNQKTFLIDLDKTLYKPTVGIFDEINENIKKFMINVVGINPDMTDIVRKNYIKTFGSTLMGLIKDYSVNPMQFLEYVHDVDVSAICENLKTKETLKRLVGKRVIFTSAPKKHAIKVLSRLNVLDLFDDIFDIFAADFIAKPNKEPYLKVACLHKSVQYTMIDDMEQNLITAKALHFKTVLVNENKSDLVDICVNSFEEIPVEVL